MMGVVPQIPKIKSLAAGAGDNGNKASSALSDGVPRCQVQNAGIPARGSLGGGGKPPAESPAAPRLASKAAARLPHSANAPPSISERPRKAGSTPYAKGAKIASQRALVQSDGLKSAKKSITSNLISPDQQQQLASDSKAGQQGTRSRGKRGRTTSASPSTSPTNEASAKPSTEVHKDLKDAGPAGEVAGPNTDVVGAAAESVDAEDADAGMSSSDVGARINEFFRDLVERVPDVGPYSDDEGGRRRGRGKSKKEESLQAKLHKSWGNKDYMARLDEMVRSVEPEECKADEDENRYIPPPEARGSPVFSPLNCERRKSGLLNVPSFPGSRISSLRRPSLSQSVYTASENPLYEELAEPVPRVGRRKSRLSDVSPRPSLAEPVPQVGRRKSRLSDVSPRPSLAAVDTNRDHNTQGGVCASYPAKAQGPQDLCTANAPASSLDRATGSDEGSMEADDRAGSRASVLDMVASQEQKTDSLLALLGWVGGSQELEPEEEEEAKGPGREKSRRQSVAVPKASARKARNKRYVCLPDFFLSLIGFAYYVAEPFAPGTELGEDAAPPSASDRAAAGAEDDAPSKKRKKGASQASQSRAQSVEAERAAQTAKSGSTAPPAAAVPTSDPREGSDKAGEGVPAESIAPRRSRRKTGFHVVALPLGCVDGTLEPNEAEADDAEEPPSPVINKKRPPRKSVAPYLLKEPEADDAQEPPSPVINKRRPPRKSVAPSKYREADSEADDADLPASPVMNKKKLPRKSVAPSKLPEFSQEEEKVAEAKVPKKSTRRMPPKAVDTLAQEKAQPATIVLESVQAQSNSLQDQDQPVARAVLERDGEEEKTADAKMAKKRKKTVHPQAVDTLAVAASQEVVTQEEDKSEDTKVAKKRTKATDTLAVAASQEVDTQEENASLRSTIADLNAIREENVSMKSAIADLHAIREENVSLTSTIEDLNDQVASFAKANKQLEKDLKNERRAAEKAAKDAKAVKEAAEKAAKGAADKAAKDAKDAAEKAAENAKDAIEKAAKSAAEKAAKDAKAARDAERLHKEETDGCTCHILMLYHLPPLPCGQASFFTADAR
eukprot:gene25882-11555_t